MSPAEKRLEIDQLYIAQKLSSADSTQSLEPLRSINNFGDFFERARHIATEICLSDPKLIPDGMDKDKVSRALRNFDYQGTPSTSDEYWPLLGAGMVKEYVARRIISDTVQGENNLGLSATEKIVLLGSNEIADAFDRLYWEWREHLVTNPLTQRLKNMSDQQAKDLLKEKGVLSDKSDEYLYAVLEEGPDDTITTTSYAQAFPEAVSQAAEAMAQIINQLQLIHDDTDSAERQALISYYTRLRNALTSTDPSQHDRLYREVDEDWLQIHGRMQPIHWMESYDDPTGLMVEPEYTLMFKDQRYDEVNNLIGHAKRGLRSFLQREYGGYASLQASLTAMESSDAGVFTNGVISGRRIDFMPAGQNIPNREIVRQQSGVKIFINMDTMWQRWATQKVYLENLFGLQKVQEIFADEAKIVAYFAGFLVGGHEIAHNAFIQPGSRASLGAANYKDIEEDKADHAIVSSAPDSLTDTDQLQIFFLGYFASLLRDLSLREKESALPYYYSGIVSLNVMHEIGMLKPGENGYRDPDFSEENLRAFFARTQEIFRELADVYEHLNPQEAQEYIQSHYVETEFIYDLYADAGMVNEE